MPKSTKEVKVEEVKDTKGKETKTKSKSKKEVSETEPVEVKETKAKGSKNKKDPETEPVEVKETKSKSSKSKKEVVVDDEQETKTKGSKSKKEVVVESGQETKTKDKSKSKTTTKKDDSDSESDNENFVQQKQETTSKVSAISNPEFIKLKAKWHELSKKIEELNAQRDRLEEEKNSFVTEMCKILENYQPKVDNLIEQKTNNGTTIGKGTISSKILEGNSDSSDSSDSDDDLPKKKVIQKNKTIDISDDDSDSN